MTTPENPPVEPPAAETPPWGSDADFDPQKAWTLIQGLRADKANLAARPAITPEQQQKLTEFERLEQASKTELERKTEELTRWQTEAEKWRSTSVSSRIQALAATDFADPSDGVNNLDANKYLGADGSINDDAIKADLADLLDRKPHYRRASEGAPPSRLPAPNAAQGSGASGKATADPAAEFAAILQGQMTGPR